MHCKINAQNDSLLLLLVVIELRVLRNYYFVHLQLQVPTGWHSADCPGLPSCVSVHMFSLLLPIMRVRDAQFQIARGREGAQRRRAYKPDTQPALTSSSSFLARSTSSSSSISSSRSNPAWSVVCLWLLFAVQVYNFNALPLDC